MVIFKNVLDIAQCLDNKRAEGHKIAFVPTMGALHNGHIALVEKAKNDGLLTVTSIFINPTQFNNKEDFEKYPVSVGDDIMLLEAAGCDVLFLPSVAEMYPDGAANMKTYDFGYLDTILEAAHRPGHFKGVGQVVARLLQIIDPAVLYMGQKDYQQCMVIKSLLTQMESSIQLRICPTVREDDGLAMSSRNRRLTDPQRVMAGLIYQCLVSVQTKMLTDSFDIVQKECLDILKDKGFVPDYVALADASDLSILSDYDPAKKMVVLIAATIGNVRLIDNIEVNP